MERGRGKEEKVEDGVRHSSSVSRSMVIHEWLLVFTIVNWHTLRCRTTHGT
jgi:hypothetical protein